MIENNNNKNNSNNNNNDEILSSWLLIYLFPGPAGEWSRSTHSGHASHRILIR